MQVGFLYEGPREYEWSPQPDFARLSSLSESEITASPEWGQEAGAHSQSTSLGTWADDERDYSTWKTAIRWVSPSQWVSRLAEAAQQRRRVRKLANKDRTRKLCARYLDDIRRAALVEELREARGVPVELSPASEGRSDGDEDGGRQRARVMRYELDSVRTDLNEQFERHARVTFLVERACSPIRRTLVWHRPGSDTCTESESTVTELFVDLSTASVQDRCHCLEDGTRYISQAVMAKMRVFDRDGLCCLCYKPFPWDEDDAENGPAPDHVADALQI